MDLSSLGTWVLVAQIAILEGLVLVNLVKFRVAFYSLMGDFKDPEKRESLFKEIAHGVMRAASERSGAIQGAVSRKAEASLSGDVSGLAISGLASFLPKKYQAFAPLIAPYIQQFLEKQGGGLLPSSSGGSSGSGQPP